MGRLLGIIVILFTTVVIFIVSIFTHIFKGILNITNIFKNKQKENKWEGTSQNASQSSTTQYQTTTGSSNNSDEEEDEEGEYIDFKEINDDNK